jgi:hypothetical protein
MCQLSSYLVTQLAIILTDIEEIARHLKLQTFLSPAAFLLAFVFWFCSTGDPSRGLRDAGHPVRRPRLKVVGSHFDEVSDEKASYLN